MAQSRNLVPIWLENPVYYIQNQKWSVPNTPTTYGKKYQCGKMKMPVKGHCEGSWAPLMMLGASNKYVQNCSGFDSPSPSISAILTNLRYKIHTTFLIMFVLAYFLPPVWMYLMDGPLCCCQERASHEVITKLGDLPLCTQSKGEYVARKIVSNIAGF